MLMSFATKAVFAYAVLLSIFHLYSPVESSGTGISYEICKDCLKSDCHKNKERPCLPSGIDKTPFICFTCEIDPTNLFFQYYSKDECERWCEGVGDTTQCACDRNCYMCVPKSFDVKKELLKCEIDPPPKPACE